MKKNYRNIIARFSILTFTVLLSVVALSFIKKVSPFEIESLLAESHPVRIAYEKYTDKYSDEHDTFILINKNQPFSDKEAYNITKSIGKILEKSRQVYGTMGLYNAKFIDYEKDQFFLTPFLKNQTLNDRSKALLKSEFWQKTLIDDSHKSLIVTFRFSETLKRADEYPLIKKIFSQVKSVAANNDGVSVHFLGTKIANHYFLVEMFRNQTVITPLLMLIIGAFFFFLFRSVGIVLWCYFVMVLCYIFTIIAIIANEGGLGPYSGFALLFVFIIATSDLIHFFTSLGTQTANSLDQRLVAVRAEVFKPCFLTSLTTCLGFSALVFNENLPVKYFGLYCSFGSIICFLITFYFLPFALKAFNFSKTYPPKFSKLNSEKLFSFVFKNKMIIVITSAVLALSLAYSTTNLKIDDNFYAKFTKGHPLSQSIRSFSKEFNFVGSIDVLVKTAKDSILTKRSQTLVKELQTKLVDINSVSHVKTLPMALDLIEQEVQRGSETHIEDDVLRSRSQSIFRLLNNYGLFESLYNEHANEVRVSVFLKSLDSYDLEQTLIQINDLQNLPQFKGILTIEPAGFSVIRNYINNGVIRNFINSFGISFLLIFSVFLVLFKSVKWAVLSMIPNIFPVIFISGLMSFFKVPMESNLIILVCIILGIGVDDTIHFVYHLKKHLLKGLSLTDACKKSFNITSQALIATTVAIIVSFPLFLISELKLFIQIGAFLLVALIVALVADFLLLPSLLLLLTNSDKSIVPGSADASKNRN